MKYFYLLFVMTPGFLWAQNLVPNPSFEEFYYCPPYPGQILASVAWDSPNNTTTDYFHRCSPPDKGASVPTNLFGTQTPHTGNAYAGIRTWIPRNEPNPLYREYLATELTDTLKTNELYEVSFWVSAAEASSYYSDDIGIYFSDTPFIQQNFYSLEPHLRNPEGKILENLEEWQQIRGFYKAKGGERYLIIGNFLDDEAMTRILFKNQEPTVYYYIDDVMVEKCITPVSLSITIDTFFCKNQPLLITSNPEVLSAVWQDQVTQMNRFITVPGSYSLTSDYGCYELQETYQVKEKNCDCTLNLPTLIIYQQEINISLEERLNHLQLLISDASGRKVTRLSMANLQQISYLTSSGVYFWEASFYCKNQYWNQRGKLVFLNY